MVIRTVSICSGIGALDLAFHRAFPESRTVLYVEREIYPVAVLAARMRDGLLDEAPVWSDITTLDGAAWRGSVDCLIGGIPCQPFSVAGKRAGLDDERWIWDDVLRIIRDAGVRLVALENVPGFVRHGLPVVLRDLADLGFDAAWRVVSAASVGAPHIRKRMFLLAYRAGSGCETCDALTGTAGAGRTEPGIGSGHLADTGHGLVPLAGRGPEGRAGAGSAGSHVADTGCECADGIQHRAGTSGAAPVAYGAGPELADSDHERQQERRAAESVRPQHAAVECRGSQVGYAEGFGPSVTGRARQRRSGPADPGFPPAPHDHAGWRAVLSERPALAPATEPTVCGMADELAPRLDQLRSLGNAVVVRQAAEAFARLRIDLGI